MNLKKLEVWFVTGSQHLYGEAALWQVAENSRQVVEGLNARSARLPMCAVAKPIVTTPQAILNVCREANAAPNCAGLVLWMHTFSPAKMWIAGLTALQKPFLHLHTQFNRDLPWATIDMDFMNLNQAAHGDREFGFICSRMKKPRKVVVGHWQDAEVQDRIAAWMRARPERRRCVRSKLPASATTCGKWPSPRATRSRPRCGSASRSTATASASWPSVIAEVSDAEVDRLVGQYEARIHIGRQPARAAAIIARR